MTVAPPRPVPPRRREHPSISQRAYAERTVKTLTRRKVVNSVMVGLTWVAAVLATLPLLFILFYLLKKGATSLTPAFFTQMPKPIGEAGGGMPIGIGAGLYLAEHKGTKLATIVRFLSDVLNGLPSIVMGIFAWQFIVRPMGHFSAIAGGIALGAMMIPMVTRTTEEMVRLVPTSLREAALALGYTRWRTSLVIVLRTAAAGIVTGALVAIARIAGETAPLFFTALGNQFSSTSLNEPIAALPLQIFHYAISPYDSAHALAWAGAVVLIGLVLIVSIAARFATRARFGNAAD